MTLRRKVLGLAPGRRIRPFDEIRLVDVQKVRAMLPVAYLESRSQGGRNEIGEPGGFIDVQN